MYIGFIIHILEIILFIIYLYNHCSNCYKDIEQKPAPNQDVRKHLELVNDETTRNNLVIFISKYNKLKLLLLIN